MPTPNPKAIEDAQAFMRRVAAVEIGMCCLCKVGRLKLVREVPAQLHHGLAGLVQACRGPP